MPDAEQEQHPSEEEIRDQLEAELRKLKVSDLLLQTVFTVSSLGFHKLAEEGRDLPQARLAIEALRALVPVLADAVPAEVTRDLNQMVANLQLAYAKAVSEAKPEPPVRESGPVEGARENREVPPTDPESVDDG